MSRVPLRVPLILKVLIAGGLIALLVGAYFIIPWLRTRSTRSLRLGEWFFNRAAHPNWSVQAGERCAQAPFLIPTDGYIGFIWGDSFRPGHQHQGLDIFGGGLVGETPVLAAYDGYLTRLPDWKSSVIIRVPQDPLQPTRQVWLYYTHMADRDGNSFISDQFPPGTLEKAVKAGDLLGYQGNYSGNALNPTGIHLHFSIVLDDGQGSFRNELEIGNTIDPSPYLGMPLNAASNPDQVPVCAQTVSETGLAGEK
jgi:murein DD-endopeptidase MepM/ murein hydrolase activator NlpD